MANSFGSKSDGNKINLQLGDIIKIEAPGNNDIDQKMFYIKYINNLKIVIVNNEIIKTLEIIDNLIQNEYVSNIYILHRETTNSFAIQNNLTPGTFISVHFGGNLPFIVNGKITNLEEDMIEITLYPNKEIIYIDFGYQGLPEEYNIEKINIIEPIKSLDIDEDDIDEEKSDSLTKIKKSYDDKFEEIIKISDDEFVVYSISNSENDIFTDDSIKIGPELEELEHTVKVSESEIRYPIENQIQDYLDKHISKVPVLERNDEIINKINHEINRYKQLREIYSDFDINQNPNIKPEMSDKYKPLIEKVLINYNSNLKWVIPIFKANKILINNDSYDFLQNENISIKSMTNLINDIMGEVDKWKNNTKHQNYTYKNYINNLCNIFDNYQNIISEEGIDNSIEFNNNFTILSNNNEDFTTYVVQNDKIVSNKFVIENANIGSTMLETNYVNNKKTFKSVPLVSNDRYNITGIITLPEIFYKYSNLYNNYTNILEKSLLNNLTINYNELLRTCNIEKYYYTQDDKMSNKDIDNIQYSNILNQINEFYFDENVITEENNYINLLNLFVPSTNKILEYVHNTYNNNILNFSSFIQYMQGYHLDLENININAYKILTKNIKYNINQYNKNFNKNIEKFKKMLVQQKTNYIDLYNINTQKKNEEIFNFIDKDLKAQILNNYNINPENFINNSELLQYIYNIDSGNHLNDAVNKNILDLVVSNLLDTYIKKTEKDKKIQPVFNSETPDSTPDDTIDSSDVSKEKSDLKSDDSSDKKNGCDKYVLSKKYFTMEDLNNDNDNLIFFDNEYDKTYYSIKQEYKQEEQVMDNYKFMEYIKNKLIENLQMDTTKALREAKAIVDNKREIIDGDYALLVDKDVHKNYIFIRKNNKWELDKKFKDNFFIDNNEIFCNSQKECIMDNDKCLDDKSFKQQQVDKDLQNILNNFNLDYNISIEEIKKNINNQFDHSVKQIAKIIKINNYNLYKQDPYKILIENNFIDSKDIDEHVILSPYKKLIDYILGQSDVVSKFNNIKKFAIKFTREYMGDENQYWLYCNKTGAKLLPLFLLKLANAFINKDNFALILDKICADQGTISDDNNNWVDKHSGYIIKSIEFSNEEGYDESGYKLNTREVIEKEFSINSNPVKKVLSPIAEMIINILRSVSDFMGINIINSQEFIINNVMKLQNSNMPTKKQYQDMIEKVAKKDQKAKTMPSYEDTYNSSLIILTLVFILISIQINIPEIKTKKTFPGCIKSFKGYPIDGDQDKSGMNYIACVASKIKSSIIPWNSIQKMNESSISKKMEGIIEKFIIKDKDIIELFNKKLEYKLTLDKSNIPEELNIKTWNTFYPPLVDFKVESKNLINISEAYKVDFIDKIIKGDKEADINIIKSKIIYFSGGIIEGIQNVIKKEAPILTNSIGDPFLENSCCHGEKNTLDYFIKKNKSISQYNDIVKEISNIVDKVKNISTASFLYDPTNTKIKLPDIPNQINEYVIYRAFIYFCNFENDIPISDELKAICMDKPTEFDKNISLNDKIEYLKSIGKNYNYNMFQELMQYIATKNTFNSFIEYPTLTNSQEIRILIENQMLVDDDNNVLDKLYYIKMNELLENFDIFKKDNPELRNIKNYIGTTNLKLKSDILTFIKQNGNLNKKLLEEFNKNLEFNIELNNNSLHFYNNYFDNFINLFGNIIINKNISLTIPDHWNLSPIHEVDIRNIINKYYIELTSFTNKEYFKSIFAYIRNKCNILNKLLKFNKFAEKIYTNKDKSVELYSMFDEDYIKLFYRHTMYLLFFEFINIENNQELILELQEYNDFDKEELNNNITNIIISFINIMFNHKNLVEIGYKKLKEKINIAKEKEKTLITDYLKNLTDEEREVENIFKNSKLEKWNKGMQKGMTQYVKTNYDSERLELEKQMIMEKKLNKLDQVSDMNKDIFEFDIDNQNDIDNEIEKEVNDMSNIPDDDDMMTDVENSDLESDFDEDYDQDF